MEMEASNKWQQERHQVAHLEKQLSKLQSGQGVVKGKGGGTEQEVQYKSDKQRWKTWKSCQRGKQK